MLHSIPPHSQGPLTAPMTHAIEACVHCGFCLAACPTYRELGQEMDTPRGRIVLMKQVLEGSLGWDAAQIHVDRCLGCLACEPACPSGVPYRDLISPFRSIAAGRWHRSARERLRQALLSRILPFPKRLRLVAQFAQIGKWLRPVLPRTARTMLDLMPDQPVSAARWPRVTVARGPRRARVALLLGCAQQVLAPDINTATIQVLSLNGVEVILPEEQGCCGGLSWHTGDGAAARRFARKNLQAFPTDVDAVLSNAAGCGSTLREYHLILHGTPDSPRADVFRQRVMDVSLFLARLGLREPLRGWDRSRRVVYQDACHLAHGQQLKDEPRALLRAIPGLELLELTDAHLCCGSAGTYNLEQPEIAARLGEQKAKTILGLRPDLVATGNVGCLMQLRAHLRKLGSSVAVRHTFQVLRDAYGTMN